MYIMAHVPFPSADVILRSCAHRQINPAHPTVYIQIASSHIASLSPIAISPPMRYRKVSPNAISLSHVAASLIPYIHDPLPPRRCDIATSSQSLDLPSPDPTARIYLFLFLPILIAPTLQSINLPCKVVFAHLWGKSAFFLYFHSAPAHSKFKRTISHF